MANKSFERQSIISLTTIAIPDHVTLEKDTVYLFAGDNEVALDATVPKELMKLIPAMIHIHGGGFWGGSTVHLIRGIYPGSRTEFMRLQIAEEAQIRGTLWLGEFREL